ncbi:TetR/AcrR family transcriptional regulator [Gorillibacterium sp. CAU 1737]|uniref:TetR/AcrR family transcriptional regulator n=1 Tax=Gorillibacterium sp. CAU 1737 TaxID=3140362 RepID=UPI0032602DE3
MHSKPYHHGDLRKSLIEAGIGLINEEGISGFSLRKVAAKCGVSHAAPYSHFKDVQELLAAMGDHVTEQFTFALQSSIEGQENPDRAIQQLGTAYIAFFEEHPSYFPFLFYHSGITIQMEEELEEDTYPPFAVFKNTARQLFRSKRLPLGNDTPMLMAVWSTVHGIAALITSKSIHYPGNWREAWAFFIKSGGNEHEADRP